MSDSILVGEGSEMSEQPIEAFRAQLEQAARTRSPRLSFMTREHHLVRDAVVTGLPRVGRPLTPEDIGETLSLDPARVETILEELEAHLFFLVRNDKGHVHWAFPVTTDETPHAVTFSSGESLYAA